MIFSLTNEPATLPLKVIKGVDIFCFFESPSSVHCPTELWFSAVCASLRMKHEILILEKKTDVFPEWDRKKRWDSGDNWCWLSPRALSVVSKAYVQTPMNFQEFKQFLKSSK